ncbi:MAG: ABC transporter permease [Pseudomonadota bacterium]
MSRILKIALRNLFRYRRRTLLTTLLITIGVVAVLLFVAVSSSFKGMMIGQITDSMLGHIQVHKKGYVSSIDNLPLHLNMSPRMVNRVAAALADIDKIEAWSPRIKLGAMFSNFTETTNIRLNGVNPARESQVSPDLAKRLIAGGGKTLVEKGKILVPELVAKGMKVQVGNLIVLVANNKNGSVNGMNFTVQGLLEGISGPGGRDGYIHVDDARALLRMEEQEVSEIAVRLKNLNHLDAIHQQLQASLGSLKNEKGKPLFEIHQWEKLTPFSNIARMIDLMTLFIKIMLVSIVLISVMNVMIMAVYERIREIGTIAAMGTAPGSIRSLFIAEGFLLGLLGAVIGSLLSLALIVALKHAEITFSFGRQQNLLLQPEIATSDVIVASIMVILVAVLASLQPAWKASRMDPIEALRHI